MDALGGQRIEARIEGRGQLEGGVVVGNQRGGAAVHLCRCRSRGGAEDARRQAGKLDARAVHGPADLVDRGKVDGPAAIPAAEAVQDRFAGIVGVAWGERLKDVEDAFVARRPQQQRKGDAERCGQNWQSCTERAEAWFAGCQRPPEHCREDSGCEQALFRPQQNGAGQRGGDGPQPAVAAQARVLPARKGVKGQRDQGKYQRLRQGRGDVVRGEGTQRRNPQDDHLRAATEEASGQRAGQPAGDEIDGNLHIQRGAVVSHAKEAEAGGQKEGVTGQAAEGGAYLDGAGSWAGFGQAVDSVLQPRPGDLAVHQAVPDGPRHVGHKPQTQQQTGQQPRARPKPEPKSLSIHLTASYCVT